MKKTVTQKSVLDYLHSIYPNTASSDEIAEKFQLSGAYLVDLQYALSRLCQFHKAIKVDGYLYRFSRY